MPEPMLTSDEYRHLVEQSPMLLWRANQSKACDYFNARWLAFTGRTMDQELGFGWTEGVHPDDFDRCLEIYTAAFDARQPFEMEYRLRRHDGAWRWILDCGVPFLGGDGSFSGYIGSCVDINDQVEGRVATHRLAELELRELKGLLPICASCRKVRDDAGYWQTVERYVERHSSAQFSHGLCPACYRAALLALEDSDGEATATELRR